uniref:Lipoprotein n=1 Tax=Streptomyces sp. NBC_00049 TaxID=2903617 RepID=A0AAU2JTU7_9ACTN
MRLSRTLTAGAALVALATLTGCGEDGEAATGTDGKSLPKAKDVAAMVRFVNQYTVCKDLETEAKAGGSAKKAFAKLPEGSGNGVKERAFCEAERGQPIVMLTVSDMKKFVAGLKAKEDAGEDGVAMVGADFAIVPGDNGTSTALKASGLLIASCKADFNSKIPSGYLKREGLVQGCLMTDYFPE